MALTLQARPTQCTLVPDSPDVLTSDQGWDTQKHASFLKDVVQQLHANEIRVSIFVDPDESAVEGAKKVGADRIELYTGNYAKGFREDRQKAIAPHIACSRLAKQLEIGVNAGHDLNLENLKYYKDELEDLMEVSIGHALIADALYYGLQNTIQMYLRQLK